MAERLRTVIVGSGPAGLSAAAHAAKLGVSHLLLEKTDHLSDTIFHFQRGKHVMATPVQMNLRADLAFDAGEREAVLRSWNDTAAALGLRVRLGAEVKTITGARGDFTVTLAGGEAITAETVILAVGTQGNPNRMRCEGADLPAVQYQLDDPGEYVDEHIIVVGGGDAGIENALGLIADPAQGNRVSLLNRSAEFETAKKPNVAALMEASGAGRIQVLRATTTTRIEPGWICLETPDGPARIRCDRVIARMGSAPPRAWVESLGVAFASDNRNAFPVLSRTFETNIAGLYVIGALAGYPLIKHCINQGHDVVEYINGNLALEPPDQPLLQKVLAALPAGRSVDEWLALFKDRIELLRAVSSLQMREFMLDAEVRPWRAGEIVFRRGEVGDSLFAIAEGSVVVEIGERGGEGDVVIGAGSFFGEVGLISGRRRGATIRVRENSILLEIPRTAALKLMATISEAREVIERVTTERQLLQMFGNHLGSADVAEVIGGSRREQIKAGEAIIREGELSRDLFLIRSGSMVVEKEIGGKTVFLSYVPAGSYQGEMALIDGGPRTATVRAAIGSEVIRFDGEAFARLLARKPTLARRMADDMAERRRINAFIEERKDEFNGVVDMYTSVAGFLVGQGLGEATDVLLIDERLCIGCDNCERACADTHDGLSRLDREAGRTFAHLHVPTSCRHCEHPYCMTDCPPDAIHRGADGEVFIKDTCIGCGNCQRNCPYDVIRMEAPPGKKPGLLEWMLFGAGPGPGEPSRAWKQKRAKAEPHARKTAIKCDMCAGKDGGPACVRACPTGAAIRVSPETFLGLTLVERGAG